MQTKFDIGSERIPDLLELHELNCPNCGGNKTLQYRATSIPIDDDDNETTRVEGMICSGCHDLFLSIEETARFLNVRATRDGENSRYLVYDGAIKQLVLN